MQYLQLGGISAVYQSGYSLMVHQGTREPCQEAVILKYTCHFSRVDYVCTNLNFEEMDDDKALLGVVAAAAAVVVVVTVNELKEKKRKRRQMWVRPMFQCRQQIGAYNMLMAELRSSDVQMYEGFTRMSPELFEECMCMSRTRSSLIGCNTKIIAGIFDMLNVACKSLQQLKTLAVGLFYFILLHSIRTSEIK